MASLEDEIRDLREKNSELAVEIQHWKQLAAQREKEKIDLMKDVNELRLKLSKLRSGGAAEALKLDSALQAASEEALSHLVQASGAVARSIELTKQYLINRQELESVSPRWSSLSATPTPNAEKVHRVPPTLVGGQSIQPVVSLSRTLFSSSARSRSPSNRNVTERAAVPVHLLSGPRSPDRNVTVRRPFPMNLLLDVYIPLTRINVEDLQNNAEDNNDENSGDDANDDDENLEENRDISEYESSRRLDVVMEDMEAEENSETPQRSQIENPLEGPSWLLDSSSELRCGTRALPDSTTTVSVRRRSAEVDVQSQHSQTSENAHNQHETEQEAESESWPRVAFTPTVRRRKRAVGPPRSGGQSPPRTPPPTPTPPSSPQHHSPPHPARSPFTSKIQKVANVNVPSPHFSPKRPVRKKQPALNQNRVPKVIVARMQMSGGAAGDSPPSGRPPSAPAPAPAPAPTAPPPPRRPTKPTSHARPAPAHAFKRHTTEDSGIVLLYSRSSDRSDSGASPSNGVRLESSDCDLQVSRDDSIETVMGHLGMANGDEAASSGDDEDSPQSQSSQDVDMCLAESRSSSRTKIRRKPVNRLSRQEDELSRRERSLSRHDSPMSRTRRVSRTSRQESVRHSQQSSDSDSSVSQTEGRSRRPRKIVTYKEKPLNRKLRR